MVGQDDEHIAFFLCIYFFNPDSTDSLIIWNPGFHLRAVQLVEIIWNLMVSFTFLEPHLQKRNIVGT